MLGMKSAAIFSKPAKPELAQIVPELLRWFQEHDYQVLVDQETAAYTSGVEAVERSAVAGRNPNFVVVLGAMARCWRPHAPWPRPEYPCWG